MPVDFISKVQQERYGRYAGEPSREQLARYFHLDDRDRTLVGRLRGERNRLGFAVQLGTVCFLGTFISKPSDVPPVVTRFMARQLAVQRVHELNYIRPETLLPHVDLPEALLEIQVRTGFAEAFTTLE